MNVMDYVLGGILILAAIFLVIAVLMQSSKSRGLSGTIAGGAETFFGKEKAGTIEKKLATATTIVAVIFVVLVLVVYLAQSPAEIPNQDLGGDTTVTDSVTDPVTEPETDPAETDPETDPAGEA